MVCTYSARLDLAIVPPCGQYVETHIAETAETHTRTIHASWWWLVVWLSVGWMVGWLVCVYRGDLVSNLVKIIDTHKQTNLFI
jgi:hypothetical protein